MAPHIKLQLSAHKWDVCELCGDFHQPSTKNSALCKWKYALLLINILSSKSGLLSMIAGTCGKIADAPFCHGSWAVAEIEFYKNDNSIHHVQSTIHSYQTSMLMCLYLQTVFQRCQYSGIHRQMVSFMSAIFTSLFDQLVNCIKGRGFP
jgi:hypothetical protein